MPRLKKTPPNHGEYYEYKITVGTTIEGKPIRKSFYSRISKDDAKEQAEQYQITNAVSEITGVPIIKHAVPFTQYSAKLLELKKSTIKAYSYMTTYEVNVVKYIDPYFGKYAINNIKPLVIRSFFSKYSYLSESMLDKFKIILNAIFELAIENDDCFKNPTKNITPGGKKPKVRPVYNAEQENKIFQYCLEHGVVDIVILLDSGIRRSELLGIDWDKDIDYINNTIYIEKAITPAVKGAAVVGDPKSESSRRGVPVSATLISFLKANKGTGYVIKGREGSFMSPSGYAKSFRSRMDEICKTLDIPSLTPHELRHTFGTLQHENGTDIHTLSKAMGHADINITSKTYVHDKVESIRKNMHIRENEKNDAPKKENP